MNSDAADARDLVHRFGASLPPDFSMAGAYLALLLINLNRRLEAIETRLDELEDRDG